jgi:hypothetical protein
MFKRYKNQGGGGGGGGTVVIRYGHGKSKYEDGGDVVGIQGVKWASK